MAEQPRPVPRPISTTSGWLAATTSTSVGQRPTTTRTTHSGWPTCAGRSTNAPEQQWRSTNWRPALGEWAMERRTTEPISAQPTTVGAVPPAGEWPARTAAQPMGPDGFGSTPKYSTPAAAAWRKTVLDASTARCQTGALPRSARYTIPAARWRAA
jgi:hypothetical protein